MFDVCGVNYIPMSKIPKKKKIYLYYLVKPIFFGHIIFFCTVKFYDGFEEISMNKLLKLHTSNNTILALIYC